MAVATGHYTAVFPHHFLDAPLNLHRTYLGVDLFFLLSGFILMHVYAAGFAGGVDARQWGRFMVRRLARIYPLHLATLILTIVFARQGLTADQPGLLLGNLTLIHAWGFWDDFSFNSPSWSVSCEFAAYLPFPVLAMAAMRRGGLALMLGLSATGLALLLWRGGGSVDLDAIGRNWVLARALYTFPMGMALALLWFRAPLAFAALGPLAVVGMAGAIGAGAPDVVVIFGFAALVLGTAHSGTWFGRLLVWRPLRILGDWSYGIYLLHWPLMLAMFSVRPKLAQHLPGLGPAGLDLLSVAIFLPSLTLLAGLSYVWLESPLRRQANGLLANG